MKKGMLILIVILAILGILTMQGCGSYNSMVTLDEEVKSKWGAVQTQYQRRADLIPNLVKTVKGVADFEKETYVQVAQARAGKLNDLSKLPLDKMSADKMAELQKASAEAMKSAQMMINVAFERYPQLKANENFSQLQSQLEGTENRITVARDNFNNTVKDYNVKVRTMPSAIFAKIFGFTEKDMFSADKGAEKAPSVEF